MVFKVDFKKLMNFFQKQPATYVIRKKNSSKTLEKYKNSLQVLKRELRQQFRLTKKNYIYGPQKPHHYKTSKDTKEQC